MNQRVMRDAVLRATLISYIAVVAVPLAALTADPTLALLAGCALLGAVVGTVATARIDPQEWLDTWPRVIAGFAVPVGWFALALATGPTPDGVAISPLFVGAIAVVPWLLAIAIATYCRTRDRIEAATIELSFEARPPSAVRREYQNAAAVGLGLVALGGIVALVLGGGLDETSMLTWLPAMTVVFVVLLDEADPRQVSVTDIGIVVDSTIHEWDTITSFTLDDEELAITRTNWYHSTLRYDRDDIEDVEAVVDALSKYVPQD